MNIELFIQALLAIGTIIGGGVAAYATYRSTNSSVKVQEKQLDLESKRVGKELNSFGIEEAERISNITLSNLQFMQQQVSECALERSRLREENNRLTLDVTNREVRTMKKRAKIKDAYDKLVALAANSTDTCSPIINDVITELRQILDELEESL